MSLLTDEGLPDPSQMNIFEQMTVGQLENWWTQTQELGAALGLTLRRTRYGSAVVGSHRIAAGFLDPRSIVLQVQRARPSSTLPRMS